MRTLATKQPTHDSAKQKKPRKKGRSARSSALRLRSVSPLLTGMPLLQRKCACGGGCPRCKEDLGIQTKLKIGEPNDKYEQEADRIADEVMRMPEPSVQRQVELEEEEMVQRKAITPSISPLIQRQDTPDMAETSEVPPIVNQVLNSPSQPLEPKTRTFMESRFGYDFSQVRVHTDAQATRSAKDIGALAYTKGQDIVFSGYMSNLTTKKRLVAHELTHVLQQTFPKTNIFPSWTTGEHLQSPVTPLYQSVTIVQRLSAAHGQHVSGGQADLTADLTSPIVVGTNVRFESRWGYVPGIGAGERIRYYWAIRDRDTNDLVLRTVTQNPSAILHYSRVGQYRVVHSLLVGEVGTGAALSGGRLVGGVSMDQDVVAEDSTVAQQSSDLRELINNFRRYIIDAANSTGSLGITPLLLASVLRMEIENTTPFGISSTPWYRRHEIAGVESEIANRERGQAYAPDDINRSIGVGQIRMSTAAMLFGHITWRDQPRTARRATRSSIARDFDALSTVTQRNILTELRWPRSNINAAARLLERLKNRPNRYPTMTRLIFGSNQRAVEIIATEYNAGSTTTLEADAGQNYYGQQIWTYMQESFMQSQFPNT